MGFKVFLKLIFLWAAALIIVLGPYLAIVHGLPWLVQEKGWTFANADPNKLSAALNPHYWIVLLVYLTVSFFFVPSYDSENLGLFGTRRDNPFSMEDDYNRTLQTVYQLLLPGKLVCAAGLYTLAVAKRLTSSSTEGD
ncbi:MAG: hypothetical protein KC940_17850 [Candidatus Omnitrophica bacterium]|nr:hypothetical protein [Candidatus Omnitrophota bacterium]MCB9768781.1 hypothetical protein [Candidatus Omnitrophota bacterium]